MKRRGGGEDRARRRMLESEGRRAAEASGGCEKRQRLEWRLVKYDALPEYLKDNEFILDYYRAEWPLKETLLSVFSWHNETLNVWSHLGGFILFLVLTVLSSMEIPEVRAIVLGFSRAFPVRKNMSESFWPEHLTTQISEEQTNLMLEPISRVPRWPWFIFLSGAMVCLASSSISHLLSCHSRRLNLFFWRLDYSGISLMIVSSFFPPIYYAFLCHPVSRLFYLTTIAFLGLAVVLTLLSPALSSPRFRPFRASLFLAMGFSGVVPAIHALLINWDQPSCHVALAYELLMAIAYGTGAVFYVTRVPERWKPGAFDIAGHSHQIFHVFVIAGALAHYTATRVLMDWRDSGATCQVNDAAHWGS